MEKKDRLLLLASLSMFFFCGCLALLSIRFGSVKSAPSSLMVSPTVSEMGVLDPRPKIESVTKLCFSEDRFQGFMEKEKKERGQSLLATGSLDDGRTVEIYADVRQGGSPVFSVFLRDERPDAVAQVCRFFLGRNLKVVATRE